MSHKNAKKKYEQLEITTYFNAVFPQYLVTFLLRQYHVLFSSSVVITNIYNVMRFENILKINRN